MEALGAQPLLSPCSVSQLSLPVRSVQRRLHALLLLAVSLPVLQRLQQPFPHCESHTHHIPVEEKKYYSKCLCEDGFQTM